MITALVVDDETPARLHVRQLLQRHPDITIVAEASNGLEALERIAEHMPDVVFLDIEMPGLNGFDVLRELRAPPATVFVTAFGHYAIEAFDANALDYVLKPVQADRLARTLDRVRRTLFGQADSYRAALRSALASMGGALPTKIVGRRGNRLILLSPRQILYVAVEQQLVFLHAQAERFLSDRTIAELDLVLEPAGFFRVSRSAIVNLHYARELVPWTSGTYRIRLTDGAQLDVSRERARDLKARLK